MYKLGANRHLIQLSTRSQALFYTRLVREKGVWMDHLQLLAKQFDGALLVRPVLAGSVINMAKPTVYNRISSGTFPLPIVETSYGKMVRVADIAAYLDSLTPIISDACEMSPHRKGRPTKREQVEAEKRNMTVKELRASRCLGRGGDHE